MNVYVCMHVLCCTNRFVISYQPGYATFRVYSADAARLLTVIATKLVNPLPFDHLVFYSIYDT
jgi:hypothetical protein